ncbi:hypothetical protein Tco_0550130 [Tanacetum coccineum]
MLGASRVQIPEKNLDNLKLIREEDGEFETVDPQCLLGFEMLVCQDPKVLSSLFIFTDFAILVFLWYILISGLEVVTDFKVVSLRGSTLVEVNLVKGHEFLTIVKVRLVGFHLYPISVNTLPVGFQVCFFLLLLADLDLESTFTSLTYSRKHTS